MSDVGRHLNVTPLKYDGSYTSAPGDVGASRVPATNHLEVPDMGHPNPSVNIPLRSACNCGCQTGHIVSKSGQDCVYCDQCERWQYNAPRTETGRAVRNLSSRPTIKPSERARVLAAHDHACVGCGKRPPEVRLELDHIISREVAAAYGMLDALIDSHWNLAPLCPECNSGKRWVSEPSVRLMYRCLMMKATPRP